MKFLPVILFLITVTSLLGSNELKKAEVVKGELRLQFAQNIDKKNIHTFTLSHPYRKVFDISACQISSEARQNIKSQTESLKIAQYKPNTVRIVVVSDKPYICTPYKPMLSKNLYHIPLPKKSNTVQTIRYRHSQKHVHKKLDIQTTEKVKLIKTPTWSHRNELIVIDAGHGGHDTGAIGAGKREKDLVLQIARRVEKELKKRGYPVYLTRRTDRFLKLPQRTKIADKKGAVAFISIHANSVPKRICNRVHGIETFFLQNTRDAKSQRIAARENAAVLKGAGSKLSKHVIVDSVLNGPKIIESNKLAIDVQRGMMSNLRTHYRGVKDSGVRHAPFWVLVGASRPSILVEVGYISNPKERKRLFSSNYQYYLAKGIAEGVDHYLRTRKKEIGF